MSWDSVQAIAIEVIDLMIKGLGKVVLVFETFLTNGLLMISLSHSTQKWRLAEWSSAMTENGLSYPLSASHF